MGILGGARGELTGGILEMLEAVEHGRHQKT